MDNTSPTATHEQPSMNMVRIAAALLVLTLASFITLMLPAAIWSRPMNATFVLLVATGKATLVVAFFMHYYWERPWKYVLTIPPLFLVFVLLTSLLPEIAVPPYPTAGWGGAPTTIVPPPVGHH